MRNFFPQFWRRWSWRRGLPPPPDAQGCIQPDNGAADGGALAPPLPSAEWQDAAILPRQALVKKRPVSLEQRYSLLEAPASADAAFRRLQARVFEAAALRADQTGTTIFREAGRIAPNRLYFYVKPQNQRGWLVERSAAGWLVTGAEKIVAQDMFLRDREPVDSVLLYERRDESVDEAAPAKRSPRVRVGGDVRGELLAFTVYEHRLLKQLGIEGGI